MTQPTITVVADPAELARRAADRFTDIARESQSSTGAFRVALSGGSTPRAMFRLLARPPDRDAIDWTAVGVYWGDERAVPPDDPESNYRMAKETLLDKVPVPSEHVHRMRGELEPASAADGYQRVLLQTFSLEPGQIPRFDLILLGIGADGHTASLFPGTPALSEQEKLVFANPVPKLDTVRLTVTAPVLRAASHILVLASGAEKADAVARAIEGAWHPEETPSQLLREAGGTVEWMLDRAAAAGLESTTHSG